MNLMKLTSPINLHSSRFGRILNSLSRERLLSSSNPLMVGHIGLSGRQTMLSQHYGLSSGGCLRPLHCSSGFTFLRGKSRTCFFLVRNFLLIENVFLRCLHLLLGDQHLSGCLLGSRNSGSYFSW